MCVRENKKGVDTHAVFAFIFLSECTNEFQDLRHLLFGRVLHLCQLHKAASFGDVVL